MASVPILHLESLTEQVDENRLQSQLAHFSERGLVPYGVNEPFQTLAK